MSNPPVLIVGAGASGLVLALSLAKYGIPFRLIEKELKHRPGQRGVGIMPRSLEIHSFLGTYTDIERETTKSMVVSMYGPDGRTVVATQEMSRYVEPTPSVPYSNPLLLGQDRQEAILRSHLEKYGHEVELGTELVSFEEVEGGVVAHVVKTTNGERVEETIECDYLVRTDGAHSIVRKKLGLEFIGETRAGENIVTGDISVIDGEKILSQERWHIWGAPARKMFILRPTAQGDIHTFIVMGKELDHAHLASGREPLIEAFYEITGRKDIQFGDLVWISNWRANIRRVDRFSVGRIFLAGDSAHCHSPTGGQGMNTSVQDAFNLAWKLALVIQGNGKPSLLDSYGLERLPIVTEMLNKTTELLNKTVEAGNEGPSEAAVRREGDLHQLGINYRYSPIVVEDGVNPNEAPAVHHAYQATSGIHAGDRAPDAPDLTLIEEDTSTSLFKLFGTTYHTILVFSPNASSNILAPLVQRKEGLFKTVLVLPTGGSSPSDSERKAFDVVVRDQNGHAAKGYSTEGVTAVVVRPDSYIGAIVHDSEGLKRYISNIFIEEAGSL